jgi:hypothetical protein
MTAALSIVLRSAFAEPRSFSPTSCGVRAAVAGSYTVLSVELSAAVSITSTTGASNAVPAASAIMTTTLHTSMTTISRTRSNRSAITPPYAPKTIAGTNRTTVDAPTHAVDPVSSKIQTTRATL